MDKLAAARRGSPGGPYELADVSSKTNLTGDGDDMRQFYAEIDSILNQVKEYRCRVDEIDELQSRLLDTIQQPEHVEKLNELLVETSHQSTAIKRRIQNLERQGGSGRDAQVRKQQVAFAKSKFVDAIKHFQAVEQRNRSKQRQRLERQYKIVNPNADEGEIYAVLGGGEGVFTQALMASNRFDDSTRVYKEVQERHNDIRRIEQTIAQLAQLFNDMSVLVEQQDETLNVIQATAGEIEKDTEAGLKHTQKAVVSARSARKKRWICFFLTLLILVVIGVIAAVVITKK